MVTATRGREPQRKLTPEEATSFDRYSATNAAQAIAQLVESGACSGTCEPYQDIFTYKRWLAQGYQVQRGQHGARLTIVVHGSKADDKTGDTVEYSRPWHTTVFCRHQGKEV